MLELSVPIGLQRARTKALTIYTGKISASHTDQGHRASKRAARGRHSTEWRQTVLFFVTKTTKWETPKKIQDTNSHKLRHTFELT